MTQTMRAAVVETFDGPSAVNVTSVDALTPEPGEVLIDVHYAGVSYPDLLHTRGLHQDRPSLPFIPGWEVAGVVAADAEGFHAGDRVAAMSLLGGFAEQVAVPASLVLPLPDSLALDDAAAIPLNYLTAVFGLVHRGGLHSGDTVLVQGASGGVGTAAVQVATGLGARVIGVVSSKERAGAVTASGASEVVLADDFLAQVKKLTDGEGVDLVFDPVGGDRFTDSLRCLATDGRLLVVGFTGGDIPTVKVNRLLLANTGVLGVNISSTLRSRPEVARQLWDQLLPLIDAGWVGPIRDQVWPLAEAAQALVALEQRRVVGKQLLQVR